MFLRNLLHNFHSKLVMVGGDIRCGKDGGKFVLRGCDLVMLGLCENAEFPKLFVQLFHKCLYTRLNYAEIMIFKLLPFGWLCAEKSASCIDKVFSLFERFPIDEEVFLFRTYRRFNGGYVCIAKQFQNAKCLTVDGFHGTQ